MRIFGIILVLVVWLLLGWKLYTDWGVCCRQDINASESPASSDENLTGKSESTEETARDELGIVSSSIPDGLGFHIGEPDGPMLFSWSETMPSTTDEWPAAKSALLESIGTDQILEITGFYNPREQNNSDQENLGLGRANEVKGFFLSDLSDERINLLGRVADAITNNNPFVAASFEFKDFNREEEKIVNIGNRIDIYFPFNSTRRIVDPVIEDYLNKVAGRLNRTGESIRLTGHTDNIGSPESNRLLGQARAEIIRDYLIRKGVPNSRIIATSKGETEPVASNSNPEGRSKNRRAELQIIQ